MFEDGIRVVRTLQISPRLAIERFHLMVPRGANEPSSDEWLNISGETIVDEFLSRDARPHSGSFPLWMRSWPSIAAAETRRGGANLAASDPAPEEQPRPIVLVERDARGLEPLEPDRFWALIDTMRQSSGENAVNRISRALAAEDDDTILRFAQAGDKAMFELDTPDRARRTDGRHPQPEESEWQRGAIIAHGRDAFDAAVADPSSMSLRWLPNMVVTPAFLASMGWGAKHEGEVLAATTSWSTKAGANTELWGEVDPDSVVVSDDTPTDPPPVLLDREFDMDEFHDRLRGYPVGHTAAVRAEFAHLDGQWYSARAFVQVGEKVEERIVAYIARESDRVARATQALAGDDGIVLGDVEHVACHAGPVSGGVFFELKRRKRPDVLEREYLDTRS